MAIVKMGTLLSILNTCTHTGTAQILIVKMGTLLLILNTCTYTRTAQKWIVKMGTLLSILNTHTHGTEMEIQTVPCKTYKHREPKSWTLQGLHLIVKCAKTRQCAFAVGYKSSRC